MDVCNVRRRGCVYLACNLSDDRVYKIGVTRGDVSKRMKDLQTGSSGEIMLIRKYETDMPFHVETMLHRLLSHLNVNGEWYSLSDEMVSRFCEMCRGIEEHAEALRHNPFFKYDKLK